MSALEQLAKEHQKFTGKAASAESTQEEAYTDPFAFYQTNDGDMPFSVRITRDIYMHAKQTFDGLPEFKRLFNEDLDRIRERCSEFDPDMRNQDLCRYDFASTVMAVLLGMMQGYKTVQEIVKALNCVQMFSATVRAMLPKALPFNEPYRYATVCGIVLKFAGNSAADIDDTDKKKSVSDSLHALLKTFSVRNYSDVFISLFEYAPSTGFLQGNRFVFSQPRFIVIGFDGQELRASFLPQKGSSRKNYTSVNLIDCTHKVSLDFRIRTRKNHEREAFFEMLSDLNDTYDLSNVIFVCDALNSMPDVVDAIVDAGGHYMIPIKGNNINKSALNYIEQAMVQYADSEHMHCFENEIPLKEHGRISSVSVRGIAKSHIDAKQLQVKDLPEGDRKRKSGNILINDITDSFPSAESIISYNKDCEFYRNSCSEESLAEMNKSLLSEEEREKRNIYFISDCNVDEPEMFRKLLCVLNERWTYEVYHNHTDENLGQDRIYLSNELSVITRVGFNRISMNFCLDVRKHHPERNPCPGHPMTIADTYDALRNDLDFFLQELSRTYTENIPLLNSEHSGDM